MDDKMMKLSELLSDEEYAKKLFAMSVEDAQKELERVGLRFSTEELIALAQGIRASLNENGELNEGELENVAGGRNQRTVEQGKEIGRKIRPWLIQAIKWAWGYF